MPRFIKCHITSINYSEQNILFRKIEEKLANRDGNGRRALTKGFEIGNRS